MRASAFCVNQRHSRRKATLVVCHSRCTKACTTALYPAIARGRPTMIQSASANTPPARAARHRLLHAPSLRHASQRLPNTLHFKKATTPVSPLDFQSRVTPTRASPSLPRQSHPSVSLTSRFHPHSRAVLYSSTRCFPLPTRRRLQRHLLHSGPKGRIQTKEQRDDNEAFS